MSNNEKHTFDGIGFIGMLTIVFITLKLTHVINWSWRWVLSPIRIGVIELNPDIQFITNVGIFEYGRFSYKETNKYLTIIGDKFVNPELLGAGL